MTAGMVTDLVVAGIVVLSGLFALARGLVKEVLSIASWVGAVVVTVFGFMPLRPYFRDLIGWPAGADIATAALLFLFTLFTLSLLSHQVSKLVQGSAVGAVERSLGLVFGLARGVLIVVLLYMALSWMVGPTGQPRWFREARTVPFLMAGAEVLMAAMPQHMSAALPMLVSPERPPPPQPEAAPETARKGYPQSERRQMNRLIDGAR